MCDFKVMCFPKGSQYNYIAGVITDEHSRDAWNPITDLPDKEGQICILMKRG